MVLANAIPTVGISFLNNPTFLPPQACLAQLFHAGEIQFHGRRAAKSRDRNLQPAVIAVDFLDPAVEIRERAVHATKLLVSPEAHIRLRTSRRYMDAVETGATLLLVARRCP